MSEQGAYPFAMTPEEIVTALYTYLLGRAPDSAGLQGWSNLIVQQNDPSFALKWIMESDEFKARHPRPQPRTAELAALALSRLGRMPCIVDVGAQTLGPGSHIYDALLRFCEVEIIGFDPLEDRLKERSEAEGGKHVTLLPYAMGDGGPHTLYVNNDDATSSLYPLDVDHNRVFPGLIRFETVRTIALETKRMDDVVPSRPVDLMKLDVQGGELLILKHAVETLRNTAVVHCEVEFGTIYKDQPLFSDVESFLREQGFYFVDFPTIGRYARENKREADTPDQMVWADAVFFRQTDDPAVKTAQALIAAVVYQKGTLASHLLDAAEA